MVHSYKQRSTSCCRALKKAGEPEYLHSVTIEEDEADNFNLGLTESGMNYMIKLSTLFVERESINKFYSKTSADRI